MTQARWDETTRRVLIRRSGQAAALFALPAFLGACGDDDQPTGASSGSSSEPKVSGRIDFLGFEGDDYPEQVEPWASGAGVELRAKYAATAPDIIAQIKGGQAQGTDLITFPQNWTKAYNANGLLKPLDPAKIPNYAKLAPTFQTGVDPFTKNEQGELIAVPFHWGTLGITYDAGATDEITSYAQLLSPELKGKIAILDLPIAVLQAACVITGFSPDTLTKAQFAETSDLVKRLVAQAKTIAPTGGDVATLLGSKEVIAVFNGYPTLNGLAAKQGNTNVKTNITPKEGATAYIELYGIPPMTDNEDAALAMVDHVLEPEVNAAANSSFDTATVTADGADVVSEANKALYPYDDIDGYFEKARLMDNPPGESDEFVTAPEWIETWQGLKSGA